MPIDNQRTRTYRRLIVGLVLFMAGGVAYVGAKMAWRGKGFYAFLALCVLAWLILVIHGYRQDEREGRRDDG